MVPLERRGIYIDKPPKTSKLKKKVDKCNSISFPLNYILNNTQCPPLKKYILYIYIFIYIVLDYKGENAL